MTQDEAIAYMKGLLGRWVPSPYPERRCTGQIDTCPVEECMLCGIRECPNQEPLHFHHDGCPSCEYPYDM